MHIHAGLTTAGYCSALTASRPTLQISASECAHEAAQFVRAARVLELAQRLGFDLANALVRDVELLASDAATVLVQLPAAFEHFNEVHPHSSLKMRSPRDL
jgi:transposase InsO family protein